MIIKIKTLLKKSEFIVKIYNWIVVHCLLVWKRNDVVVHKFTKHELQMQREKFFDKQVKISILVPLFNTDKKMLIQMIESVINQSYSNWELCLTDASDSTHIYVERICNEYKSRDARINYKKLDENLGIADNTNECFNISSGDYFALLDHDDILSPAALFYIVSAINNDDCDAVYTDECKFIKNIYKPITIYCKPDFSPDLLRSMNYITHFYVFSRKLYEQVGGFDTKFNGSQDYDMILRTTEKAHKISHIPKVLYFWRCHSNSAASNIKNKPYAVYAGMEAIKSHVNRIGYQVEIESTTQVLTHYRLKYKINIEPLVSIVIPNKNHFDDLKKCVDSIQKKTTYAKYEIIIVDNDSDSEELKDYYRYLRSNNSNIRIYEYNHPFNFSAEVNFGVEKAKGDYVILLNNDTEIITPEWIEEMLMYAQRKDVGIVGVKLYFLDDTIQHAGVIVGMGGVAGHLFCKLPKDTIGYCNKNNVVQNLSAVTAACMMVKKTIYEEVNGFDENNPVNFNDVDFCLRVRQKNYLIVFTPFAELYHAESKSRGYDNSKMLNEEAELFKKKWKCILDEGDPYYNPNFSYNSHYYKLVNK